MPRKFKKMLKNKGKFKHSSRRKDTRLRMKYKKESNRIICFEYLKPIHMKPECPKPKKRRYSCNKKKKSLMVTWDDSDIEKSSNLDNEQANIFLMADTNDKVEISLVGKCQGLSWYLDSGYS